MGYPLAIKKAAIRTEAAHAFITDPLTGAYSTISIILNGTRIMDS
jgi:hypothetical protein